MKEKEVKKLYNSITNINNRYIEEAQSADIKKSPAFRKWVPIAACLVLAVGVFAAVYPWNTEKIPAPNTNGEIVRTQVPDEYPTTGIVSGFTLDEPYSPDDVSFAQDCENGIELSLQEAYEYEPLGKLMPRKWIDGQDLSEYFPKQTVHLYERDDNLPGSCTVMSLILDSVKTDLSITIRISEEKYFSEMIEHYGIRYNEITYLGNKGSGIYVNWDGYVIAYYSETQDLAKVSGLFDMIHSAECFGSYKSAVYINEIEIPTAASALFALSGDDYNSMNYEELLKYFDLTLPVSETLSYLNLRDNDYGVYQTEEREIYYDGNTVRFESEDGSQCVNISLAKAFKRVYDIFDLTSDELHFTDINGRELAIFHYSDEKGQSCYHVEFLQNGTAVFVTARNISEQDFVKCMKALVNESEQSSVDVHTVSGKINSVDSYANYIGITSDSGSEPLGYGINLPDGISAEDYSLGDSVTVTFTGEPATVCTVWAEQLISIDFCQ